MPKRVYASEVNDYNPLDFSVDQVKPSQPTSTISHLGNKPKITRVSSPPKKIQEKDSQIPVINPSKILL